MALRSNADTAFTSRTSGMVNHNAAYTICFWAKLSADRDQYTHFWAASDTTTDTYEDSDFVGTDNTGINLRGGVYIAAAGTDTVGAALTVGTWYHIAVKRTSATDWRMYVNGAQSGITVTQDITGRNATLGEFLHRLNGTTYFCDGVIAHYKAWDVALTDAQIAAEMRTITPKRWANLVGWTPFISSVKADSLVSRVGGNWTENGTLAVEQGPPVSWGAAVLPVYKSAAAGGNVFLVDVTDGMFMDDGTAKGRDAVQADPVFLNDNFNNLIHDLLLQDSTLNVDTVTKITGLYNTDPLLLNDAFTTLLREMLQLDNVLLSSSSFSTTDKNIIDNVLLAETIFKLSELNFLDSMFLYDSTTTEKVSSGATITNLLLTDYMLLLDDALRLCELTQVDSLLLSDNVLRDILKELLDSIVVYDNGTRTVELTLMSSLLIGEVVSRLREMTILEGVYLGEITSSQLSLAGAAAMVYARIRHKDFLVIQNGYKDLLGIMVGWVPTSSREEP